MPEEDRPYDASDPRDVRQRIKADKQWSLKRDAVIVSIMSSPDGRRWIREFLEHCMVGQNPFNPEPVKMAFNCGGLNAGQVFMAQVMNAEPRLYMQMMAEANEENEDERTSSDTSTFRNEE